MLRIRIKLYQVYLEYHKSCVILMLLCLTQTTILAQFTFKEFGTKEGLPSEQVYDITQDNNGILWFATDNGLCSYDGRKFHIHDLTQVVGNNHVLHLYSQKSGDIIGTTISGALFVLDGSNQELRPFRFNNRLMEEIGTRIISSIYCTQTAYYFSFKSGTGYVKIDTNGGLYSWVQEYPYGSTTIINAIKPGSSNGEDFTATVLPSHADRLQTDGFEIRSTPVNDDFFQRSNRIDTQTVYSSREFIAYESPDVSWKIRMKKLPLCTGFYQNSIWVGLQNAGVEFYSKSGSLIGHELEDKSVTDLFVDHQGGIWVSTLHSGVFYESSPSITKVDLPLEEIERIEKLVITPDQRFYLGLNDGQVLSLDSSMSGIRKVGQSHQMHSIVDYSELFEDFVSIERLGKTKSFGLYIDGEKLQTSGNPIPANLLSPSCFTSINRQDELLVVGDLGLYRIREDGYVDHYPTAIDLNDAIRCEQGYYVATYQGIRLLDTLGRLVLPGVDSSFFNQPVYQLHRLGKYFVGSTSGKGLIFFNHDTTFEVNSQSGLPAEKINYLYSLDSDTLWVCCNSGIYQVYQNMNAELFVRSLKQGLGGSVRNVKSIQIKGDQIWMIKPDGLYKTSRGHLTYKSKEVFFRPTNFKVNGVQVPVNNLKNLGHKENNIALSYQAISFSENLRFRYKLKGLEDEWHYTDQFSLSYSSLPPGEYNLMVQALLGSGSITESKIDIPIKIIPALYDRLWFRIVVMVFLSVLIYSFFRLKILNYNRDIIREILRQLLKKIKGRGHLVTFRDQGKNVQLQSKRILFAKAANNNVEIYTNGKVYTPRMKLSDFLKIVPDKLEYLQVHRSYIVRLDNVEEHDGKSITIDSHKIPIGDKYKHLFLHLKPGN